MTRETPWGIADFIDPIDEGIAFYSTPSHGGFLVSRERLEEMPLSLAAVGLESEYHGPAPDGGAWFEEDYEAAAVVVAFPELFTTADRAGARRVLRSVYHLEVA